ncbi:MAG: Ig-like domain-containing protein [Chloroflexi bacterium]|nr:Ig-like domain-containing protein [Chloroflexota bacterium]
MRRFKLWLLVSLLVSLSASTLLAQDATGAPLRVVQSSPATGQELAAGEPVTISFNQPINCDTSGAFSISPAVEGSVTCDNATASIIFTPSRDYARATPYTVTISTALQAVSGGTLLEPYTLEVNGQGYLEVTDVLPKDGSFDIATDAAITVIFNRPVVPLVSSEEAAALPSPITISPAVEGTGEWLNTAIYVFHPEPGFAGGSQYTVTVNPDLTAQDGATLEALYSWSFSTVEPMVVEVNPQAQATGILLTDSVQVKFNQAVDHTSAEAAFSLTDTDTNTAVDGTFEWAEDSTGFRFIPAESLNIDTVYEAVLNAGVEAVGGGKATADETRWSFVTVPSAAIISTDPQDGATDVYPYGSMTIYFASQMNVETLKDKIMIEPKPWRDPDYYYGDYDHSYNISFPVEPSTTYTVTIAAGMEDVYGNAITEPRTITFTTAPYEPTFALEVPGEVGFYNANAEQTRLYLTHRNISSLNLQLYNVPLANFTAALAQDSYSAASNFTPDPATLLRDWQLDATSDLNVSEYELLQLAGGDQAANCEGAPPSRLHVGDVVVVISGPEAVRARASVPDGEVIDQLYRDYQMPIVGGPVCANSIVWWQVRLRDDRMAWVAEAVIENGALEYLLDVRIPAQTAAVTVTNDGETLRPGVYLLKAESPETAALGYQPTGHFLIVASANLTMKYSVDEVLIWATDAQTGQPIPNAPITLTNRDNSVLQSGVTDADGLVRLSIPRVTDLYQPLFATLQTETQFGLGFSEWSSGIEPYQFGQNYNYFPERYRTYLYTDRPLYRPDQPVYFRGVIREQKDVAYTPADVNEMPVRIIDPEGQIVMETSVPVTAYGTFSGQFDIADDAPLGYYQVQALLPGSDPESTYQPSSSLTFGVAEYRLPEFQVNVTPSADAVVQDSDLQVTIDSRYFFGGAVSNANVEYTVVSSPYFFQYGGNGYYDFEDFNYDEGASEFYGGGSSQVASGSGVTDAEGQLVVTIPAALEDSTQSQTFTIEATITDESQQVVAGRTDVVVHKGEIYIGARPEEYVGLAGEESSVNLIAVDWASNGIANQTIDVEVVERRWSNVQEQDESGRTTWTWQVEEIPVTTGSVTTDATGKAVYTFTPPNGGVFKVKIKTRDGSGNEVIAATTMWVSSGEYVSWRQQNSNRIDLIADKKDYSVGDTAEILIASPFQGTAEALVTVERGSVLSVEHVTLTSNSLIYEVPITGDFAPNVYVSVVLVKGVDENNPVAAFRTGLVQLGVDNNQKEIQISITPDKEQAGPRETVNYTVTTTDYAGNPVQAEVGVGLTDLASLSIADPNSSPILGFFYGQQGLGVRTTTPLTINVDLLTQTVIDTIKGGGGGGGEGGIFDIRQDFVDTAYWNATLTTDANGTATFSVTLPDNLTTWRLDARAVTSGEDGLTLVGQDTFDLLSTKPLLIRPVTPRFFVVGDKVMLAAVVNNNTGDDLPVEVSIQGEGLTFDGDAAQTFTIAASGRQRVEWTATVEDAANVDLTFFAQGGEFTDASKPPLGQGDNQLLPVYKYEVPETVGTAGVLRDAGSVTEAIALPQDATQGELTVKIDPSLAATTLDGLTYLKNFPYQCLEQTVSRFLPNIMTYRALDSLGVANAELRSDLEGGVNFALQRLYAQQKPDGGWGWFVQDASNPLTTAYALIGLAEAKNAGFPVGDEVITAAQNYLRTTFITLDLTREQWELNRQAFTLYALARSGKPDISRTANLFESKDRLAIYAKAYLALAFNVIDPTDTRRTDILLSDLNNSAITSATGVHWEEPEQDYWNWNTNTRTTAIVLDALVKLDADNVLNAEVVRWLMVARSADAWETTQETAWAVMSLTDWMVTTGELNPSYSYSASLNGETLTEGTASPETVKDTVQLQVDVKDMLAGQVNELVIGRTEGNGVLYYTAHMKNYLPVPEVEALNNGIIIERRYTMPGTNTPVTEATVGDLVQVRLTIIVPNSLNYVVIEDPIPAGTEGVNPNLSTEQQVGTAPGLVENDPLSTGWGWWWFSNIEFRDEKVALYATYLPAGTYEYQYSIRAGLAGTYNVIPATGYEFYFPEVYGRSAGSTFTINPAEA